MQSAESEEPRVRAMQGPDAQYPEDMIDPIRRVDSLSNSLDSSNNQRRPQTIPSFWQRMAANQSGGQSSGGQYPTQNSGGQYSTQSSGGQYATPSAQYSQYGGGGSSYGNSAQTQYQSQNGLGGAPGRFMDNLYNMWQEYADDMAQSRNHGSESHGGESYYYNSDSQPTGYVSQEQGYQPTYTSQPSQQQQSYNQAQYGQQQQSYDQSQYGQQGYQGQQSPSAWDAAVQSAYQRWRPNSSQSQYGSSQGSGEYDTSTPSTSTQPGSFSLETPYLQVNAMAQDPCSDPVDPDMKPACQVVAEGDHSPHHN